MKTALELFGLSGIVLGLFCLIVILPPFSGGLNAEDMFYALLGGSWFLGWGVLTVKYLKKEGKEDKKNPK